MFFQGGFSKILPLFDVTERQFLKFLFSREKIANKHGNEAIYRRVASSNARY